MVASLQVSSRCLYCVYFSEEIQFNGEDTDSSFRDQMEPEHSSSEERKENQGEEAEEEKSNPLLANLGTHGRLSAFVIKCIT